MALYKYVIADTLRKIFDNRSIRFSPPPDLNDPYEARPVIKFPLDMETIAQTLNEPDKKEENAAKALEEFHKYQRENNVDLSSISDEEVKDYQETIMPALTPLAIDAVGTLLNDMVKIVEKSIMDGIDQSIGILCLTEVCDNMPMWAHYASNHQGFVIEFDESHQFFDRRKSPTDQLRHLRKVEYRIARPQFMDNGFDYQDLFFVKEEKWRYEQEWRMVAALQDTDLPSAPVRGLFKLPESVIRRVIIGSKTSDADSQYLIDKLNSDASFSHVRVERACTSSEDYSINMILVHRFAIEQLTALLNQLLLPPQIDDHEDFQDLREDLAAFGIYSLDGIRELHRQFENQVHDVTTAFASNHCGYVRTLLEAKFGPKWVEYYERKIAQDVANSSHYRFNGGLADMSLDEQQEQRLRQNIDNLLREKYGKGVSDLNDEWQRRVDQGKAGDVKNSQSGTPTS